MRQRKNRLRVGIFTHNYPINSKDRKDAGIFIYDFAQELAKRADVFVFCPDFGGKKENYKKVPVKWFDWGGGNEKFGNWKLFNPIYVYKFFKLIFLGQIEAIKFAKKNKIDYCLCCWAVPSAIFGLRVNQSLGIPYASWSLGSDVNKYIRFPILGQLIYFAMKKSKRLYANSFRLCELVKEVSGKECNFLPAITDFKLKKIVKPKLNKRKFNFLYVGRLENVKGPDVLVEAVNILSEKRKNFVVNVLGDGSMMNSLREKSKDVSDYINFIRWADEAAVGGYMKESNCLLIPSRNESLPLVMIEAAKVNLPVIATDVGDCKRMVKKYRLGAVVQKERPDEFAGAMNKMMDKKIDVKLAKFEELTHDFSQFEAVKTFLSGISTK